MESMNIKAELEAIVRKELNLPESAVITRAYFTISDEYDEVKIIGETEVKFLQTLESETRTRMDGS